MSLLRPLVGNIMGDVIILQNHYFATQASSGTVYSGVKFGSNGWLYARQANGGWSFFGVWLVSGANSNFNVTRVINSGTLTTDAGAGPLVLSADRIYDVQYSAPGLKTATVTFTIDSITPAETKASIAWTFEAEQGFV
jgi:hypothetical protein